MDSLTQAVLGATVGVAVAGRRIGPRKAALAGAVLGTAPDLDVLITHGDPITNYVMHRGATHSLIIQALATPLFAEPLCRLFSGLRSHRVTAYLMVYLVFATHALLDAMTIYGTKLLWPLTDHPFGVGSMFIIDPLYTLPLVVVTLWSLFSPRPGQRLGRWTAAALVVSTLYLGWSAIGQAVVTARAERVLEARGIEAERLAITPTAFNTLFWRGIAIEDRGGEDRYLNLYIPFLGDDAAVAVHAHDRGTRLPFCLDALPAARDVLAFSGGFARFERRGDDLMIADLRMGIEPGYAFDFAVARWDGRVFTPTEPRRVRSPRMGEGDLEWLLAGMLGTPPVRPRELASHLPASETQVAKARVDKPAC
jgi:inner membrane protein